MLRVVQPLARGSVAQPLNDDATEHLSEYDAIRLDPRWVTMFEGRDQRAGSSVYDDDDRYDNVRTYELELGKRKLELDQFFALGGMLVVQIDLPVQIVRPVSSPYGGRSPGRAVDSQEWFRPYARDRDPQREMQRLAFNQPHPELTLAGSGRIESIDPGPFEDYLPRFRLDQGRSSSSRRPRRRKMRHALKEPSLMRLIHGSVSRTSGLFGRNRSSSIGEPRRSRSNAESAGSLTAHCAKCDD